MRARSLPVALAAAVLLALPVAAAAAPATDGSTGTAAAATDQARPLFGAETFTLDNGLRVVVIPDHRTPVVHHMVWYEVGAADEPPGKSGIAHLLEHLMFKGTDDIEPGEFSKIVARHGGRDNAFTSSDYTAYFQTIAAEHLPLVMEMEADRMADLRLADDWVATERDVVIEERLSRTENEPAALLDERLDLALWVTHPYRNPIIGWRHELVELDRADALDFYETWYAPNNAILVISGDTTVEEVRRLAERHYGPIPSGPEIERVRPTEMPPPAAVRLEMEHPRVVQPQWKREYVAPSYATTDGRPPPGADGEEAATWKVHALQVLDELMGGGATSRIYRALVVEQKLAAAAGSWYQPRAVDRGTFGFWLTPRPGVDVAEAEDAMLAEIDHLLADGVTDAEVESAKTRMRAGVIYMRDSLTTSARVIGAALATGGTLDQVETWPAGIAAVTPEQVMQVAREVLDEGLSATGVLLPAAERQRAALDGGAVPAMAGGSAKGAGH